jgi:hypothetical protein
MPGNAKAKELVTVSDGTFTLLTMLCYWDVWQYPAVNNNGDSLTGMEKDQYKKDEPSTKFIDGSSKRTSWSNEGIAKFNVLMKEVKKDRNMTRKEWERMFQKHVMSTNESGSGERKATMQTVKLSIDDMSIDDNTEERTEKLLHGSNQSNSEEEEDEDNEATQARKLEPIKRGCKCS